MRTHLAALLAATTVLGGMTLSTPVSATEATSTIALLVPNLLQSGVPSTLVAHVSQDAAFGAPSGTVTFSDGYGATLGTATLTVIGDGASQASISWTAPPEPTVPLKAAFTPSGGTEPSSFSTYMRPQITSAPVPVALRFAPRLTAGPIALDAVLGEGFRPGSASFLVDEAGWTGSVPTIDGVASVVWQATPGIHTIVVQYSSTATNPAGAALQAGTSTQVVEVLP